MELMLEHPFVQIAGETNVEGARQAAHDVHAIAAPLSRSHLRYRDASTAENRPLDDPPPLSMTEWRILPGTGCDIGHSSLANSGRSITRLALPRPSLGCGATVCGKSRDGGRDASTPEYRPADDPPPLSMTEWRILPGTGCDIGHSSLANSGRSITRLALPRPSLGCGATVCGKSRDGGRDASTPEYRPADDPPPLSMTEWRILPGTGCDIGHSSLANSGRSITRLALPRPSLGCGATVCGKSRDGGRDASTPEYRPADDPPPLSMTEWRILPGTGCDIGHSSLANSGRSITRLALPRPSLGCGATVCGKSRDGSRDASTAENRHADDPPPLSMTEWRILPGTGCDIRPQFARKLRTQHCQIGTAETIAGMRS